MNICIDIDGTLTHSEHFIPYFNKYFNKTIREEEKEIYDLCKVYNATEDELISFYNRDGFRMQMEAKLLESAKDVLESWKMIHNLSIVTARNKESEVTTIQWLKTYELDWIPLYTIGTPKKMDKAVDLQCDIFVEDHPDFSLEAAEKNIKIILMDAAYNRNLKHKNIYRAYNWKDVASLTERIIKMHFNLIST